MQHQDKQLTVKEFKKKHPEFFKEESEPSHQFRVPSDDSAAKSWEIQEALVDYPEGRTKDILTDYYNQMPIEKLVKKYSAKSTKHMSSSIWKAKTKVLEHSHKVKNTPVDTDKHIVVKIKILKKGDQVKYCFKLSPMNSNEAFWVGPNLVKFDDDVQDFLDTDSVYANDFLVVDHESR